MERKLFTQREYLNLEPLISAMGLILVEAVKDFYGSTDKYRITITNKENKITLNDCEKVHRMLQTRLSLLDDTRDLDIEVSTPGITRTIKDAGEFSLFHECICRVFDGDLSQWVRGVITDSDETILTLAQAVNEETKEHIGTFTIPYSRIQKAKLAYGWEDIS